MTSRNFFSLAVLACGAILWTGLPLAAQHPAKRDVNRDVKDVKQDKRDLKSDTHGVSRDKRIFVRT